MSCRVNTQTQAKTQTQTSVMGVIFIAIKYTALWCWKGCEGKMVETLAQRDFWQRNILASLSPSSLPSLFPPLSSPSFPTLLPLPSFLCPPSSSSSSFPLPSSLPPHPPLLFPFPLPTSRIFPKLYSLSPMASFHQVVVNGFFLQVTIVVHDFAMSNAYDINIFINILILQVELYAGSSQSALTSPLNEQLNFVIFITISIA